MAAVDRIMNDAPTTPAAMCKMTTEQLERDAWMLDAIQADNARAARLYEELRDVE